MLEQKHEEEDSVRCRAQKKNPQWCGKEKHDLNFQIIDDTMSRNMATQLLRFGSTTSTVAVKACHIRPPLRVVAARRHTCFRPGGSCWLAGCSVHQNELLSWFNWSDIWTCFASLFLKSLSYAWYLVMILVWSRKVRSNFCDLRKLFPRFISNCLCERCKWPGVLADWVVIQTDTYGFVICKMCGNKN